MAKTKRLRPDLNRAHIALDQLPDGAIVTDCHGHAWQESRGYWYRSYGDSSMVSSFELAQRAPLTRMQRGDRL